ncbi:MAG TPA: type IV-A pilus assembly ATPase PilB [Gammaproteobacteria bacterium]|nr:type IV-A pilus assembly ATPase PilB [Gammaproteobacteria bacterium]
MANEDSDFSVQIRKTRLGGLARRVVDQSIMDREAALNHLTLAHDNGVSFLTQATQAMPDKKAMLYRMTAEEYGMPLFDLRTLNLTDRPTDLVTPKFIDEHQVLPIFHRGSKVFVAVGEPGEQAGLDAFKFQTGLGVEPILVDATALKESIEKISGEASASDLAVLDEENLEDIEFLDEDESGGETVSQADAESDTPVVRFVNKLLMDAIKLGASDIHIEPYEKRLRVRYRVDGVLHESASPPISLANRLVARIKILSRLDIAERRVPQDGRLKLAGQRNTKIDFRVSTLPTVHGEKVVMRLLDSSGASLKLSDLGMEADQLVHYEAAVKKPYGMVLVTGPTGSGKTVSLYSALSMLNRPETNISTVEDPVEINLDGINQVAINEKANLTFSVALRSFLRQDPDIIMVGEIRDLETAEIAIKASQTGHLVLSTLHTNDATATIMRMLNMGIAPYNVAGSINLIMAQRLARRLCSNCKQPTDLPPEILIDAGIKEDDIDNVSAFEAIGCDACTNGYKGRAGIFQVLPVSDKLTSMILKSAGQDELEFQAIEEGVLTLRQSALKKFATGQLSLAEVERVTNL